MNNTEKNEMSNIVLNLDVVNTKRQAPSPSSSPLVSPYESDIKRQMLAHAPIQAPQNQGLAAMSQGPNRKLRVRKQTREKTRETRKRKNKKKKKQEKAKTRKI